MAEATATPSNNSQPAASTGPTTQANDDAGTNVATPSPALVEGLEIQPQSNILDQYASYTYSLSWFLLDPTTYSNANDFTNSIQIKNKLLQNAKLLVRSGGMSRDAQAQNTQSKTSTRSLYSISQEFNLDFYIESLEIDSKLWGKGSGTPHNALKMRFVVHEPYGITLVPTLVSAVDNLFRDRGVVTSDVKTVNYAAAQFGMLISFYGYDNNGKLVSAQNNKLGGTAADNQAVDSLAVVEKFYPFIIRSIKFRVANKKTEYTIDAMPIPYYINATQSRNTIHEDLTATGSTVQEILSGNKNNQNAATPDGRQVTPSPASSPNAPQTADAAPTPNNSNLYGSLVEKLNEFQTTLTTPQTINGTTKPKLFSYKDEYNIEFNPSDLGQSSPCAQGTVDTDNTARAPQELSCRPAAVAVDNKSFSQSAHAGMQITQFIDQVMRNSKYITDQTKTSIDVNSQDPQQGKATNPPFWYKINFNAVPLKYDPKRNDFTYKITYLISKFNIVEMTSPYFNKARYRGVHKAYDYWFTGQNKDILSYEQDLNKEWYFAISGYGVSNDIWQSSYYEQQKVRYQSTTEKNNQGRPGATNEPQANGASYLFNVADMHKVSLKILGDPAWLQQGEAAGALTGPTFSSNAFNADGSINFDASEICFSVSWNAPQDYNLNQGLMIPSEKNKPQKPVTTASTSASFKPDVSTIYIAIGCKSLFVRGSFTQELDGRLFVEPTLQTTNITNQDRTSAPTSTIDSQTSVASYDTVHDITVTNSSTQSDLVAAELVSSGLPAAGSSVGVPVPAQDITLSTLQINPNDGSLYNPAGQSLTVRDA